MTNQKRPDKPLFWKPAAICISLVIIVTGFLTALSRQTVSKSCYLVGEVLEYSDDQITIQIIPENSNVEVPVDDQPYTFDLSNFSGWKDSANPGEKVRIMCSRDLKTPFGIYRESDLTD